MSDNEDETLYIRKHGSGYRIMNAEQKRDDDMTNAAVMGFFGLAAVILYFVGFNAGGFILIAGAFVVSVVFRNFVAVLFSLAVFVFFGLLAYDLLT